MSGKIFKNVLVIGAGQMGSGIGQVIAQNGVNVTFYDSYGPSLNRSKETIEKSLNKLFEKKKITEEPKNILARINYIDDLAKANKETDFCIEAVVEDFEIKKDLFKKLDEIMNPDCIFASNTSSISITKMAATISRPDKFLGVHFMNPVPIMKLVELINGIGTNEKVFKQTRQFVESLGKTVVVSKDSPGFIINRILMPWINEAFFALNEKLANAEDIDTGMKLGTNVPMGPLQLADFVGLDTCLYICEVLHKELGEDKYRPSSLMRNYVNAGWLGRKTKKGVYTYE